MEEKIAKASKVPLWKEGEVGFGGWERYHKLVKGKGCVRILVPAKYKNYVKLFSLQILIRLCAKTVDAPS
jgi:hypothetical protein